MADIERFEKEISAELPEPYKIFLSGCLKEQIEGRYFRTLRSPNEKIKIDKIFNLTPDNQIIEKWDLASSYDLNEFRDDLKPFGIIGEATGGTALLLEIPTGRIYFYDPDHEECENGEDLLNNFALVAISFDKFVGSLHERPHWEAEDREEDLALRKLREKRAVTVREALTKKGIRF